MEWLCLCRARYNKVSDVVEMGAIFQQNCTRFNIAKIEWGKQAFQKVDDFGPFWTLLDYFGALTSLPCLAIFGQNGPFFAIPPQSWTLNPNTRKGSSPGLLCVACLETPKHAIGESWTFCREMDVVQKTPKTAFLSGRKSASPHFGRSWRQNCWHQENFWGTFENFGFITEGQECTPMHFFWQVDREINEKHNFFTLWPQFGNKKIQCDWSNRCNGCNALGNKRPIDKNTGNVERCR